MNRSRARLHLQSATTDEPLASEWETESDVHMANGRLGERLDTKYLGWFDNMNEAIKYKQMAPMHKPYASHEFQFLHVLLRGLLVLRLLVRESLACR